MMRLRRNAADVGTDHGYLPAFLAINGLAEKIYASDVAEGPLENAKKTFEKLNVSDKINLIKSDGLENIPDDADEIFILGMGGFLISEILFDSKFIRNSSVHLILQPMTRSEDVRKFLWDNLFEIDRECCVEDGGRVYAVISAYYTGKKEYHSPFSYYVGEKMDFSGLIPSPEIKYAVKQTKIAKARIEGMKLEKDGNCREIEENIKKFENMYPAVKENLK